MKQQYDFANGERGKFYRPDAVTVPPVHLEPGLLEFLTARASAKGVSLNTLVNELLKKDVELAWIEGKAFYDANRAYLTGADFYAYTKTLAQQYGWEYGNVHCGHLVGNFPHETLLGEDLTNYIHPENKVLMSQLDKLGNERFWIYEIHFIDRSLEIGGFYEQLVS